MDGIWLSLLMHMTDKGLAFAYVYAKYQAIFRSYRDMDCVRLSSIMGWRTCCLEFEGLFLQDRRDTWHCLGTFGT